jgi:uncharacterized protein YjaZ
MKGIKKDTKQYFSFSQNLYVYFSMIEKKDISHFKVFGETCEEGYVFVDIIKNQDYENELKGALFHELSHLYRAQFVPLFENDNLFKRIVSEGMAMAFENEMMRKYDENYERMDLQISDNDYCKYLNMAIDIGDDDYDFEAWHYNFDRKNDFPVNLVYKLGNKLVEKYCEDNKLSVFEIWGAKNEQMLVFAKQIIRKLIS